MAQSSRREYQPPKGVPADSSWTICRQMPDSLLLLSTSLIALLLIVVIAKTRSLLNDGGASLRVHESLRDAMAGRGEPPVVRDRAAASDHPAHLGTPSTTARNSSASNTANGGSKLNGTISSSATASIAADSRASKTPILTASSKGSYGNSSKSATVELPTLSTTQDRRFNEPGMQVSEPGRSHDALSIGTSAIARIKPSIATLTSNNAIPNSAAVIGSDAVAPDAASIDRPATAPAGHVSSTSAPLGRRKKRPWKARTQPYVIAHRGASGLLPEHTVEAYKRAVDEGADFIECDVVLTMDLQPVCRHEPNVNDTTNAHAVFPHLLRTILIDGENVTGIFVSDMTLVQVKQLRAVQPWPFRNQSYNNAFAVATLEDYLDVAADCVTGVVKTCWLCNEMGVVQVVATAVVPCRYCVLAHQVLCAAVLISKHVVGIYVETKHPTWHNALPAVQAGRATIEAIVLAALTQRGYAGAANSPEWMARPAFLQSFEEGSLRAMAARTCLPMVLLTSGRPGYRPPDTGLTLEELTSDAHLHNVSAFVTGYGPGKESLVAWAGAVGKYVSTGLVERLHQHDLQVHFYTLRDEPRFLMPHLPDIEVEADLLYAVLGADAGFSDFPRTSRAYLAARTHKGHVWDTAVLNHRRHCRVPLLAA